jgi:hypothetical protein
MLSFYDMIIDDQLIYLFPVKDGLTTIAHMKIAINNFHQILTTEITTATSPDLHPNFQPANTAEESQDNASMAMKRRKKSIIT